MEKTVYLKDARQEYYGNLPACIGECRSLQKKVWYT